MATIAASSVGTSAMPRRTYRQIMPRSQSGTSLIEVLVSVAISTVGLLGMAGLMAVSAKFNQDAWLRGKTDFAVQTLIDSMHVNAQAVAKGDYNGDYAHAPPNAAPDCVAQACTPAQRGNYDRAVFHRTLVSMFPNAQASLNCGVSKDRSADVVDALCRLTISPSTYETMQGVDATQVWVFQP